MKSQGPYVGHPSLQMNKVNVLQSTTVSYFTKYKAQRGGKEMKIQNGAKGTFTGASTK